MVLTKILSYWGTKGDDIDERHVSFLDYTRKWVDCVNRGGLCSVNDEFYIFIRRVENVARSILNLELMINYRGQDLRNCLSNKFTER